MGADPAIEELEQAKEAYLRGDYGAAHALDERHVDHPDPAVRVQAVRGVAMCAYRQQQYERSEELLRAALELTDDPVCRGRLTDHLANAVGALGRLAESLNLLRGALAGGTPSLPGEAETRAGWERVVRVRIRLLNSLGATWDALGASEQAIEAYARAEELARLVGDQGALRNALGHLGRHALQREDINEAERCFEDELRLAGALGRAEHRVTALVHVGMVRARKEGRREDALERLWEALHEAQDKKVESRVPTARLALGRFLAEDGRYAEALEMLREGHRLLKESGRVEPRARAAEWLADVCARVDLHGEAFHYATDALDARLGMMEKWEDPERRLGEAMLSQAAGRVVKLHAELGGAPRSEAERDAFAERRARAAQIGLTIPDLGAIPTPAVHDLAARRERAVDLWKALLGEHYGLLHRDSRRDLSRFEVSYHSVVDDLGRCAHLLAVTVERELRDRLALPVGRMLGADEAGQEPGADDRHVAALQRDLRERAERLSLGRLLDLVKLLAPGSGQDSAPGDGRVPEWVRRARERLFHGEFASRLEDVRVLAEPVQPVVGKPMQLVQVRNAVVHGTSSEPVDRLVVDAFKRALALSGRSPLSALAQLPLPG